MIVLCFMILHTVALGIDLRVPSAAWFGYTGPGPDAPTLRAHERGPCDRLDPRPASASPAAVAALFRPDRPGAGRHRLAGAGLARQRRPRVHDLELDRVLPSVPRDGRPRQEPVH